MTEKKETELERLSRRRAAITARMQTITARQNKAQRSRDTRRKILVGAFMMEQWKAQGKSLAFLVEGDKAFLDWLEKDGDKELFKDLFEKRLSLRQQVKNPIPIDNPTIYEW